MIIQGAKFEKSSADHRQCPLTELPEYAFIGRSNVGKSSLINMITGSKKLAKTSGTPGKTRLINHFRINEAWFLVDLPGYGFAKISKRVREKWEKMIHDYLLHRKNLVSTFILIDSRHEPQASDMEFIRWFGEHALPFVLIFTKSDKLGPNQLGKNIKDYQQKLLTEWEELPLSLITSSKSGRGKEEILELIDEMNAACQQDRSAP
jgi:GTP-binding protein